MKFALSKNPQLATKIASTTKIFQHLECKGPLEKLEDGQMYCSTCYKTGWPVKALPKVKMQ